MLFPTRRESPSRSVLAAIVLGLLLTACPEPPTPPSPPAPPTPPPAPPLPTTGDASAIRGELEAQLAKVSAALQAKDVAGLAALFTDDGVWIGPDARMARGRADNEQNAAAFFATYESMTIRSTTLDHLVVVNDREAVSFATILYEVVSKEIPAGPRSNPFADHWRKGDDGVWRIVYEVNADGAVTAPAAEAP